MSLGDVEVAGEVALERRPAVVVVEQGEGCEIGELDAFEEHERGLQPPVGEEDRSGELWERRCCVRG